ncbi:secretion protein EspA [Rahnella sp. SAP-1]|jgi:secreted effector protein SseB|uniref:Secretion protein EspA n=1 Tax=Rouxiella aceris TaxID=2703884 RepID=A0A848MH37_9GAMM|nr:secretion protein EspA [Rouxiella aceris]NMP26479.1 secretion protein EspA [Rouxiella aceris]
MNTITIQAGNDVAAATTASNAVSEKDKYLVAMKNHSLMGQGMCTMGDMMLLFTELANAKFQQMSNKMAVSRDAQNMANKVEIAIAKIAKDGDMTELPADVIDYMRANNILVDNMTIDEFIRENGNTSEALKKAEERGGDKNSLWAVDYLLPKTALLSVQKALEHTSGTASDFVQQSQLKLQQLMQNFNTAVTMANSIQSMNGESTKSIAQSIR